MIGRLPRTTASRALRGIARVLERQASRIELSRRLLTMVVEPARQLVADGRFEDADQLLERGLAESPSDQTLLREYALCAHVSGRYAEAIARWEEALVAAPNDPFFLSCLAANLREIGHFDRAFQIIDHAEHLWPNDIAVITEAARIAETRGKFADALRYWGNAAGRRNPDPDWLRGYVHALIQVGRFDEAHRALHAALQKFPDFHGLMAVKGMLASARQDWPQALEIWTEYRRIFPDHRTGWEHLGRAQEAAMFTGDLSDFDLPPQPVAPLLEPAKIEMVSDEATRDLLLGFESIGDSCEFGGVQRRFGAEPLGLLRWNSVSLDGLLDALDSHFEGMGEESNTQMSVLDNGEYFVRDRRWDLGMHTFQFVGQVDGDALLDKMRRRIVYLRDKFLADLALGEKVFIYRSPGLDGNEIETLHRALEAHGPIRLLSVQPADPGPATSFGGMAGDVLRLGERRIVGFLNRLGVADGGYWDIAFEDWVSVCRKTAAIA